MLTAIRSRVGHRGPRRAALGLALALLAAAALAQGLAPGLVPVPPLKARVTDLTGTLTAPQIASLDESLAAFERRKGSQIAVLLVPTTKPEEIEQYAIRVAEAWKVGRKNADDGAIVVVATQDRRVRIEVGYGLEGAIPDAVAKRVIDEAIVPHFRAGDWYGGIREGTAQLMRRIDGETLPPPASRPGPGRGGGDFQSLLVVLLAVIVGVGGVLKALLGRVVGALATGGVAGVLALVIAGSLAAAVLAGIAAFVFALVAGAVGPGMGGGGRYGGWGGGPWIGGSRGGGWSSGDGGWSGGGGGFGGGGASGRW